MRRFFRLIAVGVSLAALIAILAPAAAAQRPGAQRGRPPHGAPPPRHIGGPVVFIGGYFYYPSWGPYPWWPRTAYPYPYYPAYYDTRAVLRVLVTPRHTAVYVDGFYAGIVDDFNGYFEGLPLPPGGHEIELYLDGHRTLRYRMYFSPGQTLKLHDVMQPNPPGVPSEPPTLAPPVPPPPNGSFVPPYTPRR